MNKQRPNRPDLDHTITRRKFLGTAALSSAALLGGGFTSLVSRSASAADDFDFLEKTIPELQAAMASGQVTSKDLVMGYLDRIDSLNPLLHSVIETNPMLYPSRNISTMSAVRDMFVARFMEFLFWSRTTLRPTGSCKVMSDDADDGRVACAASQPCAGRCCDYSTAARRWRSNPWQSELGEWANFRGNDNGILSQLAGARAVETQ